MGKYALVTGGSDRLGRACVLELAKQGHNVLIHYNSSEEKAKKVKEEAEGFGVKAELIQMNFMEKHDFTQILRALKLEEIELDILVNCASDFTLSTFEEEGSDLLNKEFKINFEQPYLLTKAFSKVADSGHIINFLDTKMTKNSTNRLDYILSKKSLRDFTFLSAVELAPHFKVNAIAPGLVLPPAGKGDDYLMNLAQEIPMKTIGNIEEIMKAFRYLLDSKFVTGQIMYVDGGDHLV